MSHDVIDAASGPLAGQWSDLRSTQEALRSFESDLLGVCDEIVELTYAEDDVRSFYAGAGSARFEETLGFPSSAENGGGATSRDQTRNAAVGETVERYSATYMPASRLHLSTARALEDRAMRPQATTFFADWQYQQQGFPYERFTEDTELHWVEGYDLRRGRPVMIPAQVCFLNGRLNHEEPRITYGTSNGLACGPTRAEATASGLLELVERDPLMIAWHAGLSLPRVDWRASDRLRAFVERHVVPAGLTFDVVDLSSILGVPTALGVVRNLHSDVGALALGAASRPRLEDAAIEALLEAHQSRTWCRTQQITEPRIADEDLAKVVDFQHHVRFYGERDRAARAEFLVSSPETVDPADVTPLRDGTPAELITDVLERLPDDIEVYAVDLTSPDVAEAGLSVVKVYSPNLQPLDVGWTNRFLGGDRLYQVPVDLGLRDHRLTADDLTPVPHPFP